MCYLTVTLHVFADRHAPRASVMRVCLFPLVSYFHHLRAVGLFHHQGLKKRAWKLPHPIHPPARYFCCVNRLVHMIDMHAILCRWIVLV